MKLSTRARYAARIMANIAANEEGGPVQKHRIAKEEALSSDYVEQILVSLRNAGLVNSHRGAKGGFTLASEPAKITVMDVITATDGPLSLAPCEEAPEDTVCNGECITRPIWAHASKMLEEYFSGITIKELAAKYEERKQQSIDYQI